MKIKEVIERVQAIYSKGVESDDSRLSDRHIYSKLLTVRAKILAQKKNKKQKLSTFDFQTLPCVELVVADTHECPCLPPLGCTTYRTKEKLPSLVNSMDTHLIDSVTSIDGSIIYSEVSWKEKQFKKYAKYSSNKPDFFIRNDYLYVTHQTGPKIITVTGLFHDPLEAYSFPSFCKDTDCVDCIDCEANVDKDFPMEYSLIDTVVDATVKELLPVFIANIEDQSNNTKDTITQRSK